MLRETLPKGAFHLPASPAVVEFNLGSSEMHIVSMPKAERAEARTGARIGAPLVNTQEAIEKAWRAALAAAPKPETTKLGNEMLELTIDMDLTLEAGRDVAGNAQYDGRLFQGDVLGTTSKQHIHP
jgi:hypothetical protein